MERVFACPETLNHLKEVVDDIATVLDDDEVLSRIESKADEPSSSTPKHVCRLLSGRIEVKLNGNAFVKAAIYRAVVNDNPLKEYTERMVHDNLMEYCEGMAKNAMLLSSPDNPVEEHNFYSHSLIVSPPGCVAQVPHMDCSGKTVQFNVRLVGSGRTVEYRAENEIQSVADMTQYIFNGMPESLAVAIDGNVGASTIVEKYGSLLHNQLNQVRFDCKEDEDYAIQLLGSSIHGAPACEEKRCCIFFVGTPREGADDDLYDEDFQYHSTSLFADVMAFVSPGLDDDALIYGLNILAEYVFQYKTSAGNTLHVLLPEEHHFYDFIRALEDKECVTRTHKKKVICDWMEKALLDKKKKATRRTRHSK